MKIWGSAEVLTEKEIVKIENDMFDIFEKIGFKIESEEVRRLLLSDSVKADGEVVYFSRKYIKNFLDESEKVLTDFSKQIECYAGAYPQHYLDHDAALPVSHTMQSLKNMTILADRLKNIDSIYGCMGVPDDVPKKTVQLYQRLVSWKYTGKSHKEDLFSTSIFKEGFGGVSSIDLCPFVLEMGNIMAAEEGGKCSDYCFGDLQLISPLKFSKIQADILIYLYKNGCRCSLGSILSLGGTAPITIEDALPLQLAETLFCNIIERIFFGKKYLEISNSMTPLDMRNGLFFYGRPELSMTNLAMGQLARRYGAIFVCNSFLCDAKVPSSEAGMQKTISAVASVLAGAKGFGCAGLLSVDEVGSPIQLIIDDEFAGALKRFAGGEEFEGQADVISMLKSVGHGGHFIALEHTVNNFKKNWEPNLFSRNMLSGWKSIGYKTDIDFAKEIYINILKADEKIYIKDYTEKELLKVINRAEKN